MSKRLLFVCAGNTCRSPIAAALAATVSPGVVIESAGLMPGAHIAEKASLVIKEMTGADISDRRPRDVAELNFTEFDRIVALDRMVAEDLASAVPPGVSLVVWDVPDPFGGSLDDYRRCAETLRTLVNRLEDEDDSRVKRLRDNIARWRGRLSEAEPTYCQGMASRAAKLYEALIKDLAAQRTAASDQDLSSLLKQIKYAGGAQTIRRLPLGTVTQLVLALTKHDGELEAACPTEIGDTLTEIVNVRNDTTHELAPDKMRVVTGRLMDPIEDVLDHQAFVALLKPAA